MAKIPHVPGAPDYEHRRSPAAHRTAVLAGQSQLFFAHFEHRTSLPWPEHMRPLGADSASGSPLFAGGVLAEPKYGAFRHDLLVASFHPGHRAQWTAHELCHGLVGWAFRPSAPMLFHALAAWLAELLPVSLWYFFDEAGLRRCPLHRGQGPLFQLHCPGCEVAAREGPKAPDAETRRRTRDGLQFFDRELAAIARSRRAGQCSGTRYGTIDLASDALAYARGHGRRLQAAETERWAEGFFSARQGLHSDLDALEERATAVRDAIVEGTRLLPHRATRWDYAAQDVGYRLLMARAGLDGARGDVLDGIVERLSDQRSEAGMLAAVQAYEQLAAERTARRTERLPSPAVMFAVGYPLVAGYGRALEQIYQGVTSACPSTIQALGRHARKTVAAFAAEDRSERAPLGKRFAGWLAATRSDGLADLVRLEAAICHASRPDELVRSLPPGDARDAMRQLAGHAELVEVCHAVAASEPEAVGLLPREAPRWLAVLRDAEDGVDVIELPGPVGDALESSRAEPRPASEFGLSPDDVSALMQAGLLVPVAYTCGDLASAPPSSRSTRNPVRATRRGKHERPVRRARSS